MATNTRGARGRKHPMTSIETLDDVNCNDDVWKLDDANILHQQQQQNIPDGTLDHPVDATAIIQGSIRTASQRQRPHKQPPQQKQKQQKKKNSPLSDPRLLQVIEEARYEAFVDPYRGLAPYFWVEDSADKNGATSNDFDDDGGDANDELVMIQEDVDVDDHEEDSERWWESTNINPENLKCPWDICATVLNDDCRHAWSFRNWEEVHGVVNVDEEDDEFYDIEDSKRNNNDNCEQPTLLVQCGCPTVDKLALDEFEADHKLRNTNKKKKAGNKGRKRIKKQLNETDDSITSDEKEDVSSTKVLPRLICGERSPGAIPHHPCDYNPRCLASLGGVMDHFRHSVAKITYASKTSQQPDCDISQQIYDDLVETMESHSSQRTNDKDSIDIGIRRSSLVDVEKIRTHASRFLADGDDDDFTILECMEQIKTFNRSLVFLSHENSLRSECEESTKKLLLSTPPGLRNLGATCYLNSQLQCLSQNLGFIRGLFSWIPSGLDAENRMSKIISSMQSILVQMRYGPDSVIYTNDFAAALNLENGEMQDPNEFARLLFDRMAESFRRSATTVQGSEQSCLRDLLPSVFGGRINYITQCLECGLESTRSEDFMELLIPIADGTHEGPAMKTGNKTKKATAYSDVDVQQCVNSYLYPESLDGENQYECSRCKQKQDAIRRMTFATLPPVLNIQLARYVFDRSSASKRKLTTKVLLPLSLQIPSNATMTRNECPEYILCAVQYHLGISAHGGHYVANVMDWMTGVWYEVNDEQVSTLKDGPGSSFEPSYDAGIKTVSQKKVSGSQDAYNLLYVERRYLTQQCKAEMRHFDECETASEMASDSSCGYNVIAAINSQRRERYKIELELSAQKQLQDRRVHARQEHLLKIFETKSPMFHSNPDGTKCVWIDSSFLRRLFSCHDNLDDLFEATTRSTSLLSPCLCEHSRLHPKVARRGKLIPLAVYNELNAIMERVYSMFVHDQGLDALLTRQWNLSDYSFIDGENLICKVCGIAYQHETRHKLDAFTTLLSIYDDLIPGKNDFDHTEVVNSSEIYVISRTWVTNFRKYIEKTVTELSKKSSDASCGGIDLIDLHAVAESNEDPTSKISCQHEQCSLMHNRQSARLISRKVWRNIKKIFPTAKPHLYKQKDDIAIGNCVQCYFAKEEEEMFPQKLDEWKSKILQSDYLNELLKRGKPNGRIYPSDIEIAFQNKPAEFSLCVLHHDDVQRWRNAFYTAGKSAKKKSCTMRQDLDNLLFLASDSSPSGREWKCQPIVCEKHAMIVGIPLPSQDKDARQWLDDLDDANFELLHGAEHAELLLSLDLLESIIHCEVETTMRPLQLISPPIVSLKLEEGEDTIDFSPPLCHDCIASCSHFSSIVDDEKTKKSNRTEPQKPSKKMEGPMCKIFVYEVESDTSIDVAASLIAVDISEESAPTSVASGRPRRSRKYRGGEGRFPVDELDMAVDGNLAHLRLLLHQIKGKKLRGQKLFLLRMSPSMCKSELSYEELDSTSNVKSMHEIVFGSSSTNEEISNLSDCTIHLVLSYDDSSGGKRSTRRQLTSEEKAEEETLHFSLLDIAYMGWNVDDANKSNRTKQRRQERGFQGTFLQSSDFDAQGTPSNVQNDVESSIPKDDSVAKSETLQIVDEHLTMSHPTQIMSDDNSLSSDNASASCVVLLDDNTSLHKDDAFGEGVDIDGATVSGRSRGRASDGCISTPCSSSSQPEQETQQHNQIIQQELNSFRSMEARFVLMEHRLGQIESRIDRIEYRLGQAHDQIDKMNLQRVGNIRRKEATMENGADGHIDRTASI